MTALLDPRPGKQTPGRQTQDRPLLRPVPGMRRRMATVPFVMVVAVFLALKEKTRSSMLVVLGAAVVVGVLVARLVQIWSAGV